MNATNTNTTKPSDSAWDVYRETAKRVYMLLGGLEFKLDNHRVRARAAKDEPAYDFDMRRVEQLLERAIETLDQ